MSKMDFAKKMMGSPFMTEAKKKVGSYVAKGKDKLRDKIEAHMMDKMGKKKWRGIGIQERRKLVDKKYEEVVAGLKRNGKAAGAGVALGGAYSLGAKDNDGDE